MNWAFCDEDYHYYIGLMSFQKPPLTFIYVCKYWRDVALGTARLWDSIYPSHNSTSFIEKWLQIAPNFPFHLKLVDPELADGLYPDYPRKVFRLFSKVANRWESLSLGLNPILAKEFLNFLREPREDRLAVKELNIEMICKTQWDIITASTLAEIWALIRVRMPSLERLRWDANHIATFDPQLIPWSQLKVVKVGSPKTSNPEQFLSYLSQCKSATSVYFAAAAPSHGLRAPEPQENPRFYLPFLTSLSLSRGPDPIILLQYFTLPALRHLRISVLTRDLCALDKFISRSPNLKSVMIVECVRRTLTDQDIVNYLVDPYLRRLPYFAFNCHDVEEKGPEIIRLYPQVMNGIDGIFCWREWTSSTDKTFASSAYMGWNNNLNPERLIWSYRDDKLEILGDSEEIHTRDLKAWRNASILFPPFQHTTTYIFKSN